MWNKSLITNLVAAAFVVAGLLSPWAGDQLLAIGAFALSGAITNWLAVYMLFERIPGVHGSGVIPARFEELKIVIRDLIMDEFFEPDRVRRFLTWNHATGASALNLEPVVDALDYDRLFDALVQSVQESKGGAMLRMVGGERALSPIKEPFGRKIRDVLRSVVQSESFQDALQQQIASGSIGQDLRDRIEGVVTSRLNELTPEMIKDMMANMIRHHLGWLVVWGGIFGGIIGLGASFLR